jgi:DNA-binding transcriptional MerR regulator
MESMPEAELTIDELAQRTGMTVRNLRAHQSRGLLPPPDVRGRTGYYGQEHTARVELIKELQADGFNLEAIRRLIENAGGSTEDVLRFTRTARAAFDAEVPEVSTIGDLAEQWGDAGSPELLERAVSLGLLRMLGEGRVEERSPRLGRAGAELSRLGIPTERSLDVLESLRRHADGVARTYVDLFLDQVWRPFDAAGRPSERWPEVLDALERLRPLAAESLLAMFQLAMADHVDEAVGAQLALQSQRSPAS